MKTLLKHVEAFGPKMIKVAGWVVAVKTLKKTSSSFLLCETPNLSLDHEKDKRKTLSPLLSISCAMCRSWHCMIPIFSQVARKKNPTHHTMSSRLYVPVVTFPTFMNHRHVLTSQAAFSFCLLFQTWALKFRTDLWLDMPWTTTSISETWM